MIKRAGIRSTMAKIAFGMDDAGKVLKNFKKKQIPAGYVKRSRTLGALGTGNVPGGYVALSKNAPADTWISPKLREEAIEAIHPNWPKGRPGAPVRGDSTRFLSSAGMGRAFGKTPSGANRKMTDAIVKGHELDELSTRRVSSFREHGHVSPDVILKEHNRITTMPEEFSAVRDGFKDLRLTRESAHLNSVVPGFEYGSSPRLSRHARRRITDLVEKRDGVSDRGMKMRGLAHKAQDWVRGKVKEYTGD